MRFNVRRIPLDAPDLSGFVRPFLGEHSAAVSVAPRAIRTLRPGDYGDVRVEGELVLPSGDYNFTSLRLIDGGTLRIDASAGPVRVHLGSWGILGGTVEARRGELLFEVHGAGTLEVATDLVATVIAPEAVVDVSEPGSLLEGAVFARQISVASDVTVVRADPLVPR